MDTSLAIFLPVRKGSERVINKNTRPFAGYQQGLLELKLKQLIDVQQVSEILLSTNDEESLRIGAAFAAQSDKIRIDERPDHLASSSTNLTDLVAYVPTITECRHLLWTHVTSPFAETEDYEQAITSYFKMMEEGYDSLMSVKPFRNFLWDGEKGDIINRRTEQRWPRTQDLQELYEIDSAMFIADRAVYENDTDRVGKKPILFELGGIKSFDVDWEDDFLIAEAVYEKLYRNKQDTVGL